MPDFSNFACPAPLRDYPHVILGHGGGGALSRDLIDGIFLPAFSNPLLDRLGDSTVLDLPADLTSGERLALSTDSYVVRPLFFPGGSIGELAVNGTVNDLAMSGAKPLVLTAGFILEEGLAIAELAAVVERMAAAARAAGVRIVAGDTKVVERGHGDGVYINTSGIGVVPAGVAVGRFPPQPGDVVLCSGTIGDHGMAIMSVREGLEFDAAIESDSAPLHELVAALLAFCPEIRMLRDPTRGGVATSLNEMAAMAGVGIEIDEAVIPINPPVAAACEILGLDPLQVANEGKLLAIVPAAAADGVLAAMRGHPRGRDAVILGRVVAEHPRLVVMKTAIGGTRVIPLPIGEQLPRIC
ncbi:MAG: Hydrogenase expression/formation protein HypE [Planctomycetota bacterium]|jgi:hydrogenase expression/formation protein HypE